MTTRYAFCEEGGCAEGYYNLNGICTNCSMGSKNCKKCTYEVSEQKTDGDFICHECESNEYLLTNYGECKHCNTFLDECKECHYGDNGQVMCDKWAALRAAPLFRSKMNGNYAGLAMSLSRRRFVFT